jgi:hypothetical protein
VAAVRTKRILLLVVAVVIVVGLAVLFVVAQSGHRLDKSSYGVTRGSGGHLEVVVSPCEPFRIGSVQFGHGPRGERPEIVFSATLEDRAAAVHELPTDDVPAGYSSQGSGAELGSDAVVWQLRAADDTNFLPSPFHFDARGVATGSVLRGDGARVSMDAWRSC